MRIEKHSVNTFDENQESALILKTLTHLESPKKIYKISTKAVYKHRKSLQNKPKTKKNQGKTDKKVGQEKKCKCF